MKTKGEEAGTVPDKFVVCPSCDAKNRVPHRSLKPAGGYRCGECRTELPDPFQSKSNWHDIRLSKRTIFLISTAILLLCVFTTAKAIHTANQERIAKDAANREIARMLDQKSTFEKSSEKMLSMANQRNEEAASAANQERIAKDAANRELARVLDQKSTFENSCEKMLSMANQRNEEAANTMKNASELKALYATALKEFGFDDTRIAQLSSPEVPLATTNEIVRKQANQHLPSDHRPTINSIVKDSLSSGSYKSSLTMLNGLNEDAYVKILKGDQCAASFYVRSNSNFTFSGIPDGTYRVMFCVGFGWDEKAQDFRRARKATKYDSPFIYSTRVLESERQRTTYFDTMSITLNKTVNGNVTTTDISPEEFDRF